MGLHLPGMVVGEAGPHATSIHWPLPRYYLQAGRQKDMCLDNRLVLMTILLLQLHIDKLKLKDPYVYNNSHIQKRGKILLCVGVHG